MSKKASFQNAGESINAYYILFLFYIFITIIIGYKINNDLWFILSIGREIEEFGGIYQKDMLSMHSSMDVLIQQWLYAFLVWKLYTVFGLPSIWFISLLSGFFTIIAFYKVCYMISENKLHSLYLTIFIGFFYCPYIVTRPFAISNLLLMLELFLLESYVRKGNIKKIFPLPMLSILLMNIHGAIWLLFICIAAVYIIDSMVYSSFKKKLYNRKHLIIAIIISVLCASINPYGVTMLQYVVLSLGHGNSLISVSIDEMFPLSIKSDMFIQVTLLALLLINGYLKKKVIIRYLVLSIGFTMMVFMANRGAAQFYLFACIPIAYMYKDSNLPIKFYDMKLMKKTVILVVIVILTIGFSCGTIDFNRNNDYPEYGHAFEKIIEHSEKSKEKIVLYTEFFYGGYAEFLNLKPFIDPRAEAFFPSINHEKNYFKEYIEVNKGLIPYNEFIEEYQFNYLCTSGYHALNTYLLNDSEYEIIYEDKKNDIRVFYKKR